MQQYMAKSRERGRQRTARLHECEAQLCALQEAAKAVVEAYDTEMGDDYKMNPYDPIDHTVLALALLLPEAEKP